MTHGAARLAPFRGGWPDEVRPDGLAMALRDGLSTGTYVTGRSSRRAWLATVACRRSGNPAP